MSDNLKIFLEKEFYLQIFKVFIDSWYLWLPAVLIFSFLKLWVFYIRARFISNLDWVLLEIKLPGEIQKTPKAMEVFLNSLHVISDGNFVEKYFKGKLRPWFSLEIAGINGQIHFFIYAPKFYRNLIEAQIYAQYPDTEIVEVDDYTNISRSQEFVKEWGSFGTEFKLTAEDAYPIKTYIDYGLDNALIKEEQKTDPLTSFLELLGSLKEGEQIWFQILIRATKKDWKEEGKKLVDKLMKRDQKPVKEGEVPQKPDFSPGERSVIEAVERDVSKLGFDTGIRALYLARSDKFNAINIPSMIGIMKQYNSLNLNGFRPTNTTSVDYFFKQRREGKMKTGLIDAYRKRSYFYMPYERVPFVLNTEELATIFHFPGKVAETPTFGRIEAKKGEPPSALPV